MSDKIREFIGLVSIIGTFVVFTVVMYVMLAEEQSYTMEVRPPEVVHEQLYEVDHDIPTITNNASKEISVDASFTEAVIQAMAEAVMGEAGNEPLVGKVAVATSILNRMEHYNQSVYQALEAYNAYPYHGVVTEECYLAVEIAMNNRDLFPRDMMYFRAGGYHDFGVPYVQIGNHYFSTKE